MWNIGKLGRAVEHGFGMALGGQRGGKGMNRFWAYLYPSLLLWMGRGWGESVVIVCGLRVRGTAELVVLVGRACEGRPEVGWDRVKVERRVVV